MADERIDIDVSKALGEIAKLNKGLVDVQKQAAGTGRAIDGAFDDGFALGVADALNDLEKEYGDLKRAADTLKSALRGATDPTLIKQYAQSVAQLEAGMKKLETTGKAAGVNLKNANKEASTGKQVFEGFFGAFTKATVILGAIAAVQKFGAEAIGLAKGVEVAGKQFQAFTGNAADAAKIVGTLQSFANEKLFNAQEVFDAGKGLLAFGETADNLVPVLSRIADISRATGKNFGELTTIYGKAKAAGVLYAEDINQLVDAGIPIIQEFAKQMGVSTSEVKKLASEGKISFEELQLAFFNLTEEGGKFKDQAEAGITAGDRFNVAWTSALTKVGVVLKPAWDFVLNSLSGILDSVSKLASSTGITSFAENAFRAMAKLTPGFALLERVTDKLTGKTKGETVGAFFDIPNAEEAAKVSEERLRLEKEAADKRLELAKKNGKALAAERARAEKERSQLTLAAMKEGQDKEIATENLRYTELIKQLKKYHIDTTEATEQHALNISAIELKYTLKRIQDEQALIELRKAQGLYEGEQAKKSIEAAKKHLDEQKAIRESEIDLTKAEFDNLIAVLEAGGASKERIAEAQSEFDKHIQAERLNSELQFQQGLLALTGAGDEAQIAQIKNKIALIKTELEGLALPDAPKADGPKQNLLERLGFNDDQINELRRAAGDIKSILDDITGAQVDQAEHEIELAQKRVDEAQRFYDEQKALSEQGFANDLGDAQKRLDAAKAQEQKALEQKKAAQKQQQLIDTASQISALITASARTFQAFPGPLLPIAIGIVAAMFGAFIASKARASQAAKFKHGGEGRVSGDGIIVGASHDTGGVGIEAEGGEFFGTDGRRFGIVNKRMTAKHFDVLAAVNKDDRGKMREALERLTGPQMRRDAVLDASGASGGSVVIVNAGGDKKTHRLLTDIKNKTTKTVTVEGAYIVERNGNHTRRRRVQS